MIATFLATSIAFSPITERPAVADVGIVSSSTPEVEMTDPKISKIWEHPVNAESSVDHEKEMNESPAAADTGTETTPNVEMAESMISDTTGASSSNVQ